MPLALPRFGWIIFLVGVAHAARSPKFIQLVNEGIRFWQSGKPNEAIKVLQTALMESPEDPDANNMLGLAMYDIGNLDAAEKSYLTALRVNPQYDLVHYNYALVLEARGEDKAAAAHYENALQYQNYLKVDDAMNNLANVYTRLGYMRKAKDLLEEVVYKRKNYEHLAAVSLSDILIEEGNYEEAYDLLSKQESKVYAEDTGKINLATRKRMHDLVDQHLMPADTFQVLKSKDFADGYLEAIEAVLNEVLDSLDDQDTITRNIEILDINSFGILPLLAHDVVKRILKGKAVQKGVKFDVIAVTSDWTSQIGLVQKFLKGLDVEVHKCDLRYRLDSCEHLSRTRRAHDSVVIMTGIYTNSQAPSAFKLLSACTRLLEKSGLDQKHIHVLPKSASLNLLLIENDQIRRQGSIPGNTVLNYNITDFSNFLKKSMWKVSRPYYLSRLQDKVQTLGRPQEIEIFNARNGANWNLRDSLKDFTNRIDIERNGRVDGIVTWYDINAAGSVQIQLLSQLDKELLEEQNIQDDRPAVSDSVEGNECSEESKEECPSTWHSKKAINFPCRLTIQYMFGNDGEIVVQESSTLTTAIAGVNIFDPLFFVRNGSGAESVHSLDPSGLQVNELDGNIWHVDMINDENRNRAYLAAIEKAVRPQKSVVLDLGSGSGLLAFMAASAGSPKVFGCEQAEMIASAAEKTANTLGLKNVVKIFSKKSQSLLYPNDVDSDVDVIVTETMGNDLLGELMKDIIQDANTRFGKDSTVIIPSAGRIWGQAIEILSWQDIPIVNANNVEPSAGLDRLSLLNLLRPGWPLEVNINMLLDAEGNLATKNISEPFVVTQFDFVNQNVQPNGIALEIDIEITTSGTFHAILFWWEVLLYPGVSLNTGPSSPYANMQESHWKQHLQIISVDGKALNNGELYTIVFYNDNHFSYFEALF